MRARVALAEHRRTCRLNGNDLDVRIPALEVLAHAGERAARTDARNKDIDLTVGVLPYLRPRRLEVRGGIGLVGELAGDEAVRRLGGKLLGFRYRALHALCPVGQNYLRAVGLEQLAPLYAHRLRHGEYNFIAP